MAFKRRIGTDTGHSTFITVFGKRDLKKQERNAYQSHHKNNRKHNQRLQMKFDKHVGLTNTQLLLANGIEPNVGDPIGI